MTDKTKYSNITVSNETYRELQRLSRDLLPGKTPLSISKTVTVLVNCKIQNLENSLEDYQKLIKLNNIIEKKFQNSSKKISLKTKDKISQILSKKNEKIIK